MREFEAEGIVIVALVRGLRGLCLDLGAGRGGKVCASEASVVPSRTLSFQITSMASLEATLEAVSDCVGAVNLLLGT